MYSVTCNTTDVNTCRRILFTYAASVENNLLSSAVLRQHILRAILQAQNRIDVLINKELN